MTQSDPEFNPTLINQESISLTKNLTLQQVLVTLMKQYGVTQAEIAEHLGISPQSGTVSRWYNGASKPRARYIYQLKQFLQEYMSGKHHPKELNLLKERVTALETKLSDLSQQLKTLTLILEKLTLRGDLNANST